MRERVCERERECVCDGEDRLLLVPRQRHHLLRRGIEPGTSRHSFVKQLLSDEPKHGLTAREKAAVFAD